MESTSRINCIRQIVSFDDSLLFDLKQRTFHIISMIGLHHVSQIG